MITDAQLVAFSASEMLESVNILVRLISRGYLTHAERQRQLELLSGFIEAQQARLQPPLPLSIRDMMDVIAKNNPPVSFDPEPSTVPPPPADTGDTPF